MRGTRRRFIICLTGIALLSACRDKNPTTLAGSQSVETICRNCDARATMNLTSSAPQEMWPKECPSCKRWGVYAAGTCASCRKIVPLADPRTNSYGTPAVCPHCGKPWQAANAARR